MTTLTSRGDWTSASNAEADLLCPGRHQAQKGLPDLPRDDEDAKFGESVHAVLAGKDVALSLEQCEMLEYCREIERRVVEQYFKGFKPTETREERFWATWEGLAHSGQVDCLDRRHEAAMIIDYKTGRGEVAVSPRNMQLRDLVCLAYHNLPLLKMVATVVIQPMVTRHPDVCLYTESDIHRATAEMFARVAASNAPGAPRVPGHVQCKFCKAAAAGTCPEYAKWAGTLLPVPTNLFDIAPAQWTPEQRANFCAKVDLAETWLEQTKQAMKDLLAKDPASIPGWCLKPGQIKRPIVNPQEVFSRFNAIGGKLDGFMQCISVTKGDLREQVAAATKLSGKALDGLMDKLLEGLTEEKQNRPSLAKAKE